MGIRRKLVYEHFYDADDKCVGMMPCPFCGDEAVKIYEIDTDFFECECQGCMITGCFGNTTEEAIETWNTRPSHLNFGD